MSDWTDRLRSCVYTAPVTGMTHNLLIDKVARSGEKKAAIHDRLGQDGVNVQDLGQGVKKYAMEVYIAGKDYDKAADAFEVALSESCAKKKARLQHPRWGNLVGYPLTYSQSEELVDGTRVAVFQFDFIHVPDDGGIVATTSSSAAILSAADKAASANVADIVTKSAADLAKLKKNITKTVKAITSPLTTITGILSDVHTALTSASMFIERTIDTLVMTPVDLCNQVTGLVRLPALTVATAKTKIATYKSIYAQAATSLGLAITGGPALTEAQASAAGVTLQAIGIATIEAAVSGTLGSRDDAVNAASELAALIAQLRAALDTLQGYGYYADADLLDALANLAANARAYLLEKSYSLRIERIITLEGDRNILELLRELYGEADDEDARLDESIAQNNLGGDDLLVIPRGTRFRYYVA